MSHATPEWLFPLGLDEFRRISHKLIYIGYQNSRESIKSDTKYDETAITGFLRQAIREIAITQPGYVGFYVEENRPEPSPNNLRVGKSRLLPDLVISYIGRPYLELVCEAKRLNKNSGKSKYIGAEGMGCFIGASYASDQEEVAMLGYAETKTPSEWKQILQGEIDSKATELELIPSQDDVQIISEFINEWKSKHRRDATGQPVTIFHILLDCIRN